MGGENYSVELIFFTFILISYTIILGKYMEVSPMAPVILGEETNFLVCHLLKRSDIMTTRLFMVGYICNDQLAVRFFAFAQKG